MPTSVTPASPGGDLARNRRRAGNRGTPARARVLANAQETPNTAFIPSIPK